MCVQCWAHNHNKLPHSMFTPKHTKGLLIHWAIVFKWISFHEKISNISINCNSTKTCLHLDFLFNLIVKHSLKYCIFNTISSLRHIQYWQTWFLEFDLHTVRTWYSQWKWHQTLWGWWDLHSRLVWSFINTAQENPLTVVCSYIDFMTESKVMYWTYEQPAYKKLGLNNLCQIL